MVDLAKLDELIARVEKAAGPDWDLGAEIVQAIDPEYAPHPLSLVRASIADADPSERLEAAIGLVERLLRPRHPHMTIGLRFTWSGAKDNGWVRAEITWPSHERYGHASTAPIAILEALLKALRESSERGR